VEQNSMRGKRDFKKTITRMPSGRFAWNILDRLENRVAGGLAHSYREARKKAMAAELQQPIQKFDTRVSPAFTFRNRKECGL
jgi:hypothetical protein